MELLILITLAMAALGSGLALGFNSALVGVLISIIVSQLYYMRKSPAERVATEINDAMRKLARFQIELLAKDGFHLQRITPAFDYRQVADVPTIISARAELESPKILVVTVRDNGGNFSPAAGLKAVGCLRQGAKQPLLHDAIGFGLVIVRLPENCVSCEFRLEDEVGNIMNQRVDINEK